jgi:S-adenosyl methyltransferase
VFIHHLVDSGDPAVAGLQAAMRLSLGRGQFRTRAQIQELFTGLELVEPGLVLVPDWRPDPDTPTAAEWPVLQLAVAGVGRKE